MSSTPAAPLGEPPLTGPKTCDASGMIEIHRMFKATFGDAAGLVDGVREGDAAHAGHVAAQLRLVSAALHAHHEGEDARLWDALESRAPACALHVGRMKQQHAVMLGHLSALDEALPAWQRNADAVSAGPVLSALRGINAALTERLPDEEQNIVPVMEHVLTPKDQDWFARHGRAATPKGQAWNMLGAILRAQPDGGAAWMRKNLPFPARLAWQWVGRPRYARFRAALEGRPVA
ncbi:hemerythrin domain-containing protein [Citricoccus sp. NPDC055426]|uniref:hemerythrin domain-containing protein n=1 Tax=Citricoccus sp. NPDC055426 TaxID=3155536 RepID=UPI003420F4D8